MTEPKDTSAYKALAMDMGKQVTGMMMPRLSSMCVDYALGGCTKISSVVLITGASASDDDDTKIMFAAVEGCTCHECLLATLRCVAGAFGASFDDMTAASVH